MSSTLRKLAGVVALAAIAAALVAATALGTSKATFDVSAQDDFFDPRKVKIGAGEKVQWTNKGVTDHTVKFKGEKNRVIAPGETTTKRFKKTGVFRYVCTLHKAEGMKGKVVAGDV
jgi:plastocyanin